MGTKIFFVMLFWLLMMAGVLGKAVLAAENEMVITSGTEWRYTKALHPNWENVGYDDSLWANARSPGQGLCGPLRRLNPSFAPPMWAETGVEFETVYFRRTIFIDRPVKEAGLQLTFDDDGEVFINGQSIYVDTSGRVEALPYLVDVKQNLIQGMNVIALRAKDVQGGCQSVQVQLSMKIEYEEVPLMLQTDPRWGSAIYAAGDKEVYGCGRTIADCGCVTTSVAMMLRYHGVIMDLNGNQTHPDNLNDYFNQKQACGTKGCVSQGYSFGLVNWTAVNTYALAANVARGTPKVVYAGGRGFDEGLAELEISRGNPVITKMADRNHWFILTNNDELNDPISGKKMFSDPLYNRQASQMRMFEKTNSDFRLIEITSPAENPILLTFASGEKLGVNTDGEKIFAVTNGNYFQEEGSGTHRVTVIQPVSQDFRLSIFGDHPEAVIHAANRTGKTEMVKIGGE